MRPPSFSHSQPRAHFSPVTPSPVLLLTMSSTSIPRVVPAQLSFLALYNPSLTASDETVEDQIVFYYSKATKRARADGDDPEAVAALREQKNEQLRQVGLAQGMVGFARYRRL